MTVAITGDAIIALSSYTSAATINQSTQVVVAAKSAIRKSIRFEQLGPRDIDFYCNGDLFASMQGSVGVKTLVAYGAYAQGEWKALAKSGVENNLVTKVIEGK